MKFKNISFALLAAGLLVFSSCKNENRPDATPNQTPIEATDNTGTTAALNPAHGEPGHRCEIPVGAPLDQAASNNTLQSQQQNPASSDVSPVRMNTDNTVAAPKKNPPHGQPGHDCAVPVGADLTQTN